MLFVLLVHYEFDKSDSLSSFLQISFKDRRKYGSKNRSLEIKFMILHYDNAQEHSTLFIREFWTFKNKPVDNICTHHIFQIWLFVTFFCFQDSTTLNVQGFEDINEIIVQQKN